LCIELNTEPTLHGPAAGCARLENRTIGYDPVARQRELRAQLEEECSKMALALKDPEPSLESTSRLRRILLTLEYDGTHFAGLQTQARGKPPPFVPSAEGDSGRLKVRPVRTVQQVLEAALGKIPGTKPRIWASGRTDAGVHAIAMPVHYDTEDSIPTEKIPYALNSLLPADIRAIAAQEVSADFHARKSCHWREYRYRIAQRRMPPALERTRAWWIPHSLNLIPMRHALEYLPGTHDFRAFAIKEERTTIRQIFRTHLEVWPTEGGREIWIEFVGSGFLRGQVRSMVGTLVEVGLGKRDSSSIAALLEGGTRKDAGVTAPAHGLYFVRAGYQPYRQ
jgi:tRNA pseudouridine38-40 synthase